MKWTFIGELNKFNAAADNDARETERKRWDILLCTCLSHTCIEQSILSYSSYTRANSQFICMLEKNKTNDDEIFFRVNVCVCCCTIVVVSAAFFAHLTATQSVLFYMSVIFHAWNIYSVRLVIFALFWARFALRWNIVLWHLLLWVYIHNIVYNDEHTMEWEIVNGPCHTL